MAVSACFCLPWAPSPADSWYLWLRCSGPSLLFKIMLFCSACMHVLASHSPEELPWFFSCCLFPFYLSRLGARKDASHFSCLFAAPLQPWAKSPRLGRCNWSNLIADLNGSGQVTAGSISFPKCCKSQSSLLLNCSSDLICHKHGGTDFLHEVLLYPVPCRSPGS